MKFGRSKLKGEHLSGAVPPLWSKATRGRIALRKLRETNHGRTRICAKRLWSAGRPRIAFENKPFGRYSFSPTLPSTAHAFLPLLFSRFSSSLRRRADKDRRSCRLLGIPGAISDRVDAISPNR